MSLKLGEDDISKTAKQYFSHTQMQTYLILCVCMCEQYYFVVCVIYLHVFVCMCVQCICLHSGLHVCGVLVCMFVRCICVCACVYGVFECDVCVHATFLFAVLCVYVCCLLCISVWYICVHMFVCIWCICMWECISLCVYMAHVHMYVYVVVPICTDKDQGRKLGVLYQPPTYSLETVSLLEPGAGLVSSKPVSFTHRAGFTSICTAMPSFLYGLLGFKLRLLHLCNKCTYSLSHLASPNTLKMRSNS